MVNFLIQLLFGAGLVINPSYTFCILLFLFLSGFFDKKSKEE